MPAEMEARLLRLDRELDLAPGDGLTEYVMGGIVADIGKGEYGVVLDSIRPPKNLPTETEFDAFLERAGLEFVADYRCNLYSDLCRNKWHKWNEALGKWEPIRNWRKWVETLNGIIEKQRK